MFINNNNNTTFGFAVNLKSIALCKIVSYRLYYDECKRLFPSNIFQTLHLILSTIHWNNSMINMYDDNRSETSKIRTYLVIKRSNKKAMTMTPVTQIFYYNNNNIYKNVK